jgi:hypothetical protein
MAITPIGQEAFTRCWERERTSTRLVAAGCGSWESQLSVVSERQNYDSLRGDPEYQRIMEEVWQHWEQYKQAFGAS